MALTVSIPAGGVEYIHWTLTGLTVLPSAGSVQASIDNGTTWNVATINGDGTAQLLVAHPSVTSPPSGAVVATVGSNQMWLMFTDTPEIVKRRAGTLVIS